MSYQRLNDETFPASLLMEFDELEDQILISPPRLHEPERFNTAPGTRSPVVTSHSSNSSSGNYSLSTENENGSGSSNSMNLNHKYRTSTARRVITIKDTKRIGCKVLPSGNNNKRAKSMENLASDVASHRPNPVSLKRQKYGHVKSKVKQFIDEAVGKRDRHVLVRHKSMPEANTSRPIEETDEISHEANADILRSILREKCNENDSLLRHLRFSEMQREDQVAKIESLKRKIEAMRLEETKREKEREKERQHERELEKEREMQTALAAYLRYNNPPLNKISTSVGTQTSPDACTTFNISTFRSEDSFDRLLAMNLTTQPNSSGSARVKRTLRYALDEEPEDTDENNNLRKVSADSATHPESSPDYSQLLPSTSGIHTYPKEQTTEVSEPLSTQEVCKGCARKQNKKQKKRTRLASFFCIKR